MKKDSFYFPHFCNARHDRKVKRLMKQLGVEGYGIFFMLLEVLREQTDLKFPLSDVDLLADEFGTSEAKIKTVITGYDLFQFDEDGKFFSMKQIFYLQPYFEKSEMQREKAFKRWGKVNNDATALPRESHGYATKVKETKLNETKVKVIAPEVDDDFELLEQFDKWTKDASNGTDYMFTQMLRNDFPNWGGGQTEKEAICRDHFDMLNRYPNMRPDSQQRFRNSLIRHFREKIEKKTYSKPQQQRQNIDIKDL